MNTASLIDVAKVIVERIDDPDAEYLFNQGLFFFKSFISLNFIFHFLEVAEEYMKNRNEFNRKALEMTKQHALPRN